MPAHLAVEDISEHSKLGGGDEALTGGMECLGTQEAFLGRGHWNSGGC
jgi:hypothetical protein